MEFYQPVIFTTNEIVEMGEVNFFFNIMAEHSLFIYLGILDIDQECVIARENAKKWYRYWNSLKIKEKNNQILLEGLSRFREFKMKILKLIRSKWVGYIFPSLLIHMIDELDYFQNIITNNQNSETTFWNKHNCEFMKLTQKMLDPSIDFLDNDFEKIKKRFIILKNLDNYSPETVDISIEFTKYIKEFIDIDIIPELKNVLVPAIIIHDSNELLYGLIKMKNEL